MEKILEILNELKPGVDFTAENDLVESRILDSLTIVRLVSRLSDEFDIEISPLEIVPENFKSAEAIRAMVERLENE